VNRNPVKVEPSTFEDECEVIDLALARRKKIGRPLLLKTDESTLTLLHRLAMINCTMPEAASVFGVSKQTLIRWIGSTPSAPF
jgi:hypothetical protein